MKGNNLDAEKWRGIGLRIGDDVVMEPQLLCSQSLLKTVKDIEKFVK